MGGEETWDETREELGLVELAVLLPRTDDQQLPLLDQLLESGAALRSSGE